MSPHPDLTFDILKDAVAGGVVAVRTVSRLQPAGGPGDKVFPPTYAKDGNADTRYALETRRIDGADVQTVLLDSVASQANRIEQALLEGWRDEELDFPVISVDFSDQEGLADLGQITTLDAPHRIADAILRDSIDAEGKPFRSTPVGQAFTDARPTAATAVYTSCPTALVFGVWDSTGPKGGMGAKFQRALVSEIVGIGAQTGAKTSSRLDPLGVQANVELYHRASDPDDWTADETEAQKKKGKPVAFSRSGGDGKKGKPSAVNHSNIAPSIDSAAGGVTLDYAQHTAVLSLPALRRLRFSTNGAGQPLKGQDRKQAEQAARTALAALAVAGIVYHRAEGYDLRSRSLLVPEGPLVIELVSADGGEPRCFSLDPAGAAAILSRAAAAAASLGLEWTREPLRLRPAPKLADLVRRSRAVADDSSEG